MDEEGDLFNDGSVVKTISTPGHGLSKPEFDDEVLATISGSAEAVLNLQDLPTPSEESSTKFILSGGR